MIEVLRWMWTLAALAGVPRAGRNLYRVHKARQKILRDGVNGVLRARAWYTWLDCCIVLGAVMCGLFTGTMATLNALLPDLTISTIFQVSTLLGLVLEHMLLVWLVFNMAEGWNRINSELLKHPELLTKLEGEALGDVSTT